MTRLEFLRRRGGLTQEQLARDARLSRGRISLFECHRVTPPPHGVELKRLAVVLGVAIERAASLLDEVSDDAC